MRNAVPIRVQLGPFECDLKAGELRRNGRKVRLQEQPFQILLMLVESSGELVTLEKIKKKLWPNDTVVEFDHSIHTAIKKLRQALGDSADSPRYVETVARRGYRLLVPVECLESTPPDGAASDAASNGGDDVGAQVRPEQGGLIGKKVSHYRVLAIIGGGGMGLVYKAEDLKLGRRVALKFLPEELATDSLALQRFEREARTASSLNHPNIRTIYEVEEHGDQPFIVMELLEGETLRDRLATATSGERAIPLDQQLDIAIQICDGLQAAHDKGIIHRDIKPANIFLTSQGQVKILDFGLAKLLVGEERDQSMGVIPSDEVVAQSGATEESRDPYSRNDLGAIGVPRLAALTPGPLARDDTLEADGTLKAIDPTLTRTGAAMGTAGYMSPEQIRGEKLDARTDVFSFGLVLYEMATGQRAFSGDTAPVLHDAILSHTPVPVHDLNSTLPPKLEQIIGKAIEKERERRYQSASEMRSNLEAVAADSSVQSVKDLKRNRTRQFFTVSFAALLILVCLAAVVWITRRPPVRPQLKQTQLTENSSENEVEGGAISPDGKYLAYTDLRGLHLKLLETGETRNIQEPEELKGAQVDWGPSQLSPTKFLAAASILGRNDSLWTVSVMGGAPHKVRDDATFAFASPDGSTIAFLTNKGRDGFREIWLMDTNGEHARRFYQAEENSTFGFPGWSPDGRRLLYEKDHQNGDKMEITLESRDLNGGPATTVLTDPKLRGYNWLPGGRIVYSMRESDTSELTCNLWEMRVDARGEPEGNPIQLTNWAGFCMGDTTATADGKKLVFNKWWVQDIVYVADFARKEPGALNPRRLTLSDGREHPVGWTADGKAVVFVSYRNGTWGIFKQSPGEESAEIILTGLTNEVEARLSPDGAWVLYQDFPSRTSGRLMRIPVAGGSPQLVLPVATLPEPTTSWGVVAYNPPRCARSPAQACAISERTPDNKQLAFTSFDPINGRGRELARFDVEPNGSYKWDLSPDGTRIAVLKRSEDRIRILSLDGKEAREITVGGWKNLQTVDWAADGKGLFVSAPMKGNSVLLYSDLQGKANVIWQQAGEQEGDLDIYALPSPDGRQVAMFGWTMNSNMWMLENF